MKRAIVMCIMALIALPMHPATDDGDGSTMLELHKKVTEGLIGFRKAYPDAQPKVYALLDQVNKLFVNAKAAFQKGAGIKKMLIDKTTENTALKAELAQLKGDVAMTKKTLEVAESDLRKKWEEEHVMVERLSKEKKELLSKVASLEDLGRDQMLKKSPDVQTAALESVISKDKRSS